MIHLKLLQKVKILVTSYDEFLKASMILRLYSYKEHRELPLNKVTKDIKNGYIFINNKSSIGFIKKHSQLDGYKEITYQDLLKNY